MMDSQELDYRPLESGRTGDHPTAGQQTVTYAFDRYLVQVRLGPRQEFEGIVGITVNRDFMSNAQKAVAMKGLGYHDVAEFYSQEEEE